MTLSAREQRTLLLLIALGVLILWLYTAYLLLPLLRGGATLGRDVRAARDQLNTLKLTTTNEAALRHQYNQVQDSVLVMRGVLPNEKELPAVIEILSNLASQAGVKIQTISPVRTPPSGAESKSPLAARVLQEGSKKPGAAQGASLLPRPAPIVFRDIQIQLDALAGFHQLGAFLSTVEMREQPIQVSTLRIETDPRSTLPPRVQLILRAFFAPDEPGRVTPAVAR